MAASTTLTPTERATRARLAAHARWAREPDREAATAPLRAGLLERFEREVDPDGTLTPDIRAKLAVNARKAFYLQLARKSARARRARKVARVAATPGTGDVA